MEAPLQLGRQRMFYLENHQETRVQPGFCRWLAMLALVYDPDISVVDKPGRIHEDAGDRIPQFGLEEIAAPVIRSF